MLSNKDKTPAGGSRYPAGDWMKSISLVSKSSWTCPSLSHVSGQNQKICHPCCGGFCVWTCWARGCTWVWRGRCLKPRSRNAPIARAAWPGGIFPISCIILQRWGLFQTSSIARLMAGTKTPRYLSGLLNKESKNPTCGVKGRVTGCTVGHLWKCL